MLYRWYYHNGDGIISEIPDMLLWQNYGHGDHGYRQRRVPIQQ